MAYRFATTLANPTVVIQHRQIGFPGRTYSLKLPSWPAFHLQTIHQWSKKPTTFSWPFILAKGPDSYISRKKMSPSALTWKLSITVPIEAALARRQNKRISGKPTNTTVQELRKSKPIRLMIISDFQWYLVGVQAHTFLPQLQTKFGTNVSLNCAQRFWNSSEKCAIELTWNTQPLP